MTLTDSETPACHNMDCTANEPTNHADKTHKSTILGDGNTSPCHDTHSAHVIYFTLIHDLVKQQTQLSYETPPQTQPPAAIFPTQTTCNSDPPSPRISHNNKMETNNNTTRKEHEPEVEPTSNNFGGGVDHKAYQDGAPSHGLRYVYGPPQPSAVSDYDMAGKTSQLRLQR